MYLCIYVCTYVACVFACVCACVPVYRRLSVEDDLCQHVGGRQLRRPQGVVTEHPALRHRCGERGLIRPLDLAERRGQRVLRGLARWLRARLGRRSDHDGAGRSAGPVADPPSRHASARRKGGPVWSVGSPQSWLSTRSVIHA